MATGTLEERFWSRVVKTDGCWLWTGSLDTYGYGRINHNKVHYKAHRLARELSSGPVPSGMFVCHKCDNPPCVNPDHLFVGTATDNVDDRVKKDRSARGDRNGTRTRPDRVARGELSGSAKITKSAVIDLVRAYNNNEGTMSELAARFGLKHSQAENIINGRSWRHAFTSDSDRQLIPDVRPARGARQTGERNRMAKLNEDSVLVVRSMLSRGVSMKKIGMEFGISASAVHHISTGRSWSSVK